MKKRAITLALAALLLVGLAAPALAEARQPPEIEITWLADREPRLYNRDFNWLTLYQSWGGGEDYDVVDRATGAQLAGYDIVGSFYDDLARVNSGGTDYGKWGFIDRSGAVAIPLVYDWASPFSDGLAPVEQDDKWGFIDKSGAVVVPLAYDWAGCFSDGLALVEQDNKYGFIDTSGAVAIPLEYYDVGSFSDGLAPVRPNDKWGFIDKSGAVVVPLAYDWAGCFSDGLALVEQDNKWGFIDTSGTVVVPPTYDWAVSFSDGLALVEQDDKYGFIDTSGAVAIPLVHDWACPFSDGLAPVKQNDKWGFINKAGAVVVPLEYDDVGFAGDGLCYVLKGNTYGIFDNPYWQPEEEANNFPVVPVAVGAGALVAVVLVTALALTLRKRNKLNAQRIAAAAAKLSETAERARVVAEQVGDTAAPVVAHAVEQAKSAAEQVGGMAAAIAAQTAGQIRRMGGVPCSCGAVNPQSAKFCSACGKPVVFPGLCTDCGHRNDPQARFCSACGKPLAAPEQPCQPPPNKEAPINIDCPPAPEKVAFTESTSGGKVKLKLIIPLVALAVVIAAAFVFANSSTCDECGKWIYGKGYYSSSAIWSYNDEDITLCSSCAADSWAPFDYRSHAK